MASHNLLGEGAALRAGEQLVSPDGKTRFVMQADGNAVVYQKPPSGGTGERVLFVTHNGDTLGVDGVATKFIVTRDHNLVSVDDTGKVIWESKTEGKGEGKVTLALGDNGLLVLVDEADHAVWNSGPTGIKGEWGCVFLRERNTKQNKQTITHPFPSLFFLPISPPRQHQGRRHLPARARHLLRV